MSIVFLGLGSNLGNRLKNLNSAIRLISKFSEIISVSNIYETEPWGFRTNNFFLNAVVKIKTDLKPFQLLISVKEIEKMLGRKYSNNLKGYSSRTIDIDILFYDDLILQTDDLQIPHKHLHQRKFVLMPLCDIECDKIHPVFNKTIKDLLLITDDKSKILLWEKDRLML